MLNSVTNYPISASELKKLCIDLQDPVRRESIVNYATKELIKTNQDLVDETVNKLFHKTAEGNFTAEWNGSIYVLSQKEFIKFKQLLSNEFLNNPKKIVEESEKKIFAEAARLKESAQKKLIEAQKKFAQVDKNIQNILVKQFWSIFNGTTPPPQEKYNEIFDTYLADGSLIVEKDTVGKTFFGRINSMKPVVKYLEANPLTKTCDFRPFKAEIHDVETLVDFLKTSAAHTIKGVAFKSAISEIAKQKLAEAVSERSKTKFPLKVQYFA